MGAAARDGQDLHGAGPETLPSWGNGSLPLRGKGGGGGGHLGPQQARHVVLRVRAAAPRGSDRVRASGLRRAARCVGVFPRTRGTMVMARGVRCARGFCR